MQTFSENGIGHFVRGMIFLRFCICDNGNGDGNQHCAFMFLAVYKGMNGTFSGFSLGLELWDTHLYEI